MSDDPQFHRAAFGEAHDDRRWFVYRAAPNMPWYCWQTTENADDPSINRAALPGDDGAVAATLREQGYEVIEVVGRTRSQGLEEAASFALAAIPSKHPEPCGTDACWLCAAETTLREALGLPDEEGQNDLGYEQPPAAGACGPSLGVDVLRVPGFDFDVPVVIKPDDTHRGIVRYEGYYNRPTIYLREWHERVLLHETLHVLIASKRDPSLQSGTAAEEGLVRHLTHLYELGWRFPLPAERVAREFHEAYERLAPEHGYETREDSAVPWGQVPERNRALMVATVREVFAASAPEAAGPERPEVAHKQESPSVRDVTGEAWRCSCGMANAAFARNCADCLKPRFVTGEGER